MGLFGGLIVTSVVLRRRRANEANAQFLLGQGHGYHPQADAWGNQFHAGYKPELAKLAGQELAGAVGFCL